MLNFSLKEYSVLLSSIKNNYTNIITFENFFLKKNKTFLIIRHDVDRKPNNALNMAILENKFGIKSTYYFRYKTFYPKIIKQIKKLGHEIGYHYECLSDANGNIDNAIKLFEKNLIKFKKTTNIKTISMHGRPFNKWDNRLIWKNTKNHQLLTKKFNILGEIYLDIDYKNIAYINDTGRNFSTSKFNKRDSVNSNIITDIKNINELINIINIHRYNKIIISIHPERWTNNPIEWVIQYLKDNLINYFKLIIK